MFTVQKTRKNTVF